MAIPINLCSRCDKPAETFNKDWVCEECMSGQLLDWQDDPAPVIENDPVNNPTHYNQFGIEVVDILELYFADNPWLWNAGKYLLRAGYKGHEIEDLRKLIWYVERYINRKEGHANTVPDVPSQQGNP